ncbi:Uncharacterized protein GBIM_14482 [Gryllus bimaculatus]|nr:Uncharacterized protein GBIM_14482 [Gryllus bimaculatus]
MVRGANYVRKLIMYVLPHSQGEKRRWKKRRLVTSLNLREGQFYCDQDVLHLFVSLICHFGDFIITMVKINYKLLPIKAHFFFFMAALGPILHQLNVFGKQLGVSEIVIGSINSLLPLLFLVAKPAFGIVVDYFQEQRKLIFILLVCFTNIFYILMYFIPQPTVPVLNYYEITQVPPELCGETEIVASSYCGEARRTLCKWNCTDGFRSNISSMILFQANSENETGNLQLCAASNENFSFASNISCDAVCVLDDAAANCLYGTPIFWSFVILMSLGTIGFNVANSISDAICFDVLGDGAEMGYGMQRVWGTIGFGVSALVSGYAVDKWSSDSVIKDYTPAFIIILLFGVFDFYCCTILKLPRLPRSENIFKDLGKLMKYRHVSVFIVFCVLAGIVDSFIIYYLFWYLENLAQLTGDMDNIKFLEGLIIAAETLVGEVIFFMLSGKILKLIGYGHSLTLCFIAYAVRLGLISVISNPWWFLAVELFMQGPTYAMCYTTIVVYASAVSPPGTSATMQGIVAGMDDGFGYAVGSLLGSFILKWLGGSNAFKVFAGIALACGISHYVIYEFYLKNIASPASQPEEADYKSPMEAVKATIVANSDNDHLADEKVS